MERPTEKQAKKQCPSRCTASRVDTAAEMVDWFSLVQPRSHLPVRLHNSSRWAYSLGWYSAPRPNSLQRPNPSPPNRRHRPRVPRRSRRSRPGHPWSVPRAPVHQGRALLRHHRRNEAHVVRRLFSPRGERERPRAGVSTPTPDRTLREPRTCLSVRSSGLYQLSEC